MFDEQKALIAESLDAAHMAYYEKDTFGGPSLYFHVQSLDAAREQQFDRFAECSYAMLAAWGMHRMGPRGSKMCEFEDFKSSLQKIWRLSMQLQGKIPGKLTEDDWECLKRMFYGMGCMASETLLVGNSKVLAHLVPNLVPPIDREYTLMFLFGNKQIKNDRDGEWTKMRQILREFFYPVAEGAVFRAKAEEWLAQRDRYKWDTSVLKIVDNLVIGASAISRGEKES